MSILAVVALAAMPLLMGSSPPTDPSGATSCADLGARFVALDQVLLDRIGGRSLGDYEQMAQDPPEWLLELNERFGRFASHGVELGCADGEVEAAICAGADTLEPHGEAGRDVVARLRANVCRAAGTG